MVLLAMALLSAASAFLPGAPAGTAAALSAAALVSLGAGRLHARADLLRDGGAPDATPLLRAARFCDDVALALVLLALLLALPV